MIYSLCGLPLGAGGCWFPGLFFYNDFLGAVHKELKLLLLLSKVMRHFQPSQLPNWQHHWLVVHWEFLLGCWAIIARYVGRGEGAHKEQGQKTYILASWGSTANTCSISCEWLTIWLFICCHVMCIYYFYSFGKDNTACPWYQWITCSLYLSLLVLILNCGTAMGQMIDYYKTCQGSFTPPAEWRLPEPRIDLKTDSCLSHRTRASCLC